MKSLTKISPFDIAAETYDKDFTESNIGRLQRQLVWRMLAPLLTTYARPLNILEINCGTGEDALQLARLGHRVTATDASAQMIQTANLKLLNSEPFASKPTFITCSFDQLAELEFNKPFDLVISNFGGLNCIPEPEVVELSRLLSKLVTSEGRLLLVVLGKFCLWEVMYYAVKGNFRMAFRRLKKSIPFSLGNKSIDIYYYSPGKILKLFRPSFNRLALKPIGLFVPPSYLESNFLKRPALLHSFFLWEKDFAPPSFSSLSDHYCIILNKNKT